MDSKFNIRVTREPHRAFEMSVLAYEKFEDGSVSVGELTFSPVATGAIVPPTCALEETAAQSLMDDLWACGLRPTEGRGSAGAMEATREHLQDMRKIAFNRLKIST